MMTFRSEAYRIFVWGLLILMVLVATGCGHRASHSVHQHGKKFGKSIAKGTLGHPELMNKEQNLNAARPGGEGYFSEDMGKSSDLLKEDPMVREDKKFGSDLTSSDNPNEYWVNRTRAEHLTAQSGLQDVHFEFDSFQLNEQAKATLGANAEWLKAHPHAEITIEGHCDDRGTASYNHVLGEKRALRTKNYLARLGIPAERLHIMSFGKENPVCWDSTEPCYQKNRRAHLVLDISVASTVMQYSGGGTD